MKTDKQPGTEQAATSDGASRGGLIEKVMRDAEEARRAKRSRKTLLDYLQARVSQEFVHSSCYVPFLGGGDQRNNWEAVEAWVDRRLAENPEQVRNLTPDFVVETFQALTSLVEESLYP